MNKFKFIIFPIIFQFCNVFSQELNCQVTVIVDNQIPVTTVEKEIFEQMKQAAYEMMNNTKWTKDKFTLEERINCNIQIQITSIPQPGIYTGAIQVQATRPAYNSDYNTTLINFQDDYVTFNYSRNAMLIYAPNQYRDELTSILAFYAYFIIGMDYDSFSLKGGSNYFNEAQQIVSLAQSSGGPGWLSSDKKKRNRFFLIDNILQQLFEPLRVCNYEYHRRGIDQLYENPTDARINIFKAFSLLNEIISSRPNSVNVLNFAQSKSAELKNIFIDAEAKDKSEIVNLLKKIDPANSAIYNEILN